MKNNNTSLHSAKKEKNDEFYTQLEDIEKECFHYAKHFKNKIVLCNCNDVLHKNFTLYFYRNFKTLGLKKLIATGYKVDGEHGKVCSYDGNEWTMKMLEGDGGYSSNECIEFLKESDIVVTNPPFSLFRDYVATLMKYNKKFLIVGNMNAITYKEIFPLIKNDDLWLGYGFSGGNAYFEFVGDSNYAEGVFDKETGLVKFRNCHWFTNLNHNKRNTHIKLYKKYNEEEYPKYDTYDAIEVGKTKDIPMDYNGVMGVPITFLDKYCPEQFVIFGEANHGKDCEWDLFKPTVNGKTIFKRILIKHKKCLVE